MKNLLLVVFCLIFCSCADLLAPDVLSIEEELSDSLKVQLELAIDRKLCLPARALGHECAVPEQIKLLKFTWVRNPESTVEYTLILFSQPSYYIDVGLITVRGNLEQELRDILEEILREELCDSVEGEGYTCNISSQMKSIELRWLHNTEETVTAHILFCLKESCADLED